MTGRATRTRVRWLTAASGLALVPVLLGGCFAYDAAKPSLLIQNLTDQRVTVSLEGDEIPTVVGVPANGQGSEITMGRCEGTAIVVETDTGGRIGRVEEPACPGWRLTINEDGSLTYEADQEG